LGKKGSKDKTKGTRQYASQKGKAVPSGSDQES